MFKDFTDEELEKMAEVLADLHCSEPRGTETWLVEKDIQLHKLRVSTDGWR
jgi:hypothetical protein